MQQLNLQRNYLWGSATGGTWDKPAAVSSWALEDQMRALQHQSTLAGFVASEKTMQAGYDYSKQMENYNLQRMEVSQGYQRWTMGFDRTNQIRQRAWAQEDWGYQDTMRGLSYEWGMEDINESIRGATGRERRLLVRRRDRMTTQHNLEGEQIDTQRSRQEEMWALEDQRYEKVAEYQEDLMKLDEETFELNKSHREEMHLLEVEEFERRKAEYAEQKKLQDEQIALQRQHQAESMELQEKSLGIQAASLSLQKTLAEDQKLALKNWEESVKYINQTNTYEPGKGNIGLMGDLVREFGEINSGNVNDVKDMLSSLNQDLPGAQGIINLVAAINGMNTWKLSMLLKFLGD
jgi:hypothetical protein